MTIIRIPGRKPVPGHTIHVSHPDQPGRADPVQAFRLPDDAWGYHEVQEPERRGLFALNMVNGGRWLVAASELGSTGTAMEDLAPFQNARYPERGRLAGGRGPALASPLRKHLQGVPRTSVEYVDKGTGMVKVVFILHRDDAFYAYHGDDPAIEVLDESAGLPEVIEAFHRKYAQSGTSIAYLYPQGSGRQEP